MSDRNLAPLEIDSTILGADCLIIKLLHRRMATPSDRQAYFFLR